MKELVKKYGFWMECWGIVFGILSVIFSFYMTSFYFGNHDYQFMRYGVPLEAGVWEARVTQFVPPWIFLGGQILPIFGTLFGFLFLSAAVVLLAKWYQLPEKYSIVLIFALLVVLHPYHLTQLYYVHSFISVGLWHLFTVIGVMAAWQFVLEKKIKWALLSVFFLLMALLGYASVLQLIFTALIGKFLLSLGTDFRTARQKHLLKQYWMQYILTALFFSLVVLVFYGGIIHIMRAHHILDTGMYNTQVLTADEIIYKLKTFWYLPLKGLMLELPYCSPFLFRTLLVLMVMLVLVASFLSGGWLVFLLLTTGILGLIFTMFVTTYVSPWAAWSMMRTNVYSVPYFLAIVFALIVVFKNQFLKNWGTVMAVILIICFVNADFNAQKVWALGRMQDEKVADRVRGRLLPEISANKPYRLILLGSFYGASKFANKMEIYEDRREIYREFYGWGLYLNKFASSGLFLYEPKNPIWSDVWFLGPWLKPNVVEENVNPQDVANMEMFASDFGEDKDKIRSKVDEILPYPHNNFYYIGQKDIILMLKREMRNQSVLKRKLEEEK